MRDTPMTALRRRVAARVRRMTVEQATAWLNDYHANWVAHKSIVSPPIKQLTGGLNSQSINAYVVRKVFDHKRKLERAR